MFEVSYLTSFTFHASSAGVMHVKRNIVFCFSLLVPFHAVKHDIQVKNGKPAMVITGCGEVVAQPWFDCK